MNIIVCIKQVPDTETKLKLSADGNSIDHGSVKWVINPYDEFAIEEALKLKEKLGSGTVTAVTVGPKARAVEVLRTALAMGADSGVMIDSQDELDSYLTAQALAAAIRQEPNAKIIFTGKLAIDDNASSVSQMLAEFLNLPHTTVVSKFTHEGEKATVERDADGGNREVVELSLPAVIAANKGLNLPRYASVTGIMKARKKPIKELSFQTLELSDGQPKTRYESFQLPAERPAVKMLAGDPAQQTCDLVALLKDEAKVL